MSEFGDVPEGWPSADRYVVGAKGRVAEALDHPDAVSRLVRYYSLDGNYAGRTFLSLGPIDPYSFTPGDLLAITTLSVEAPPAAIRRFLDEGTTRNHLNGLLSEHVLPLDSNLAVASAELLQAMENLYAEVKPALSKSGSNRKNRWVTASKLCARKRPDLFPVRDSVVCNFLGLTSANNYQVDWQVFRQLIQSTDVTTRVDELVDAAAKVPGVDVGHPNNRLRHLDVLLWMHATAG